MLALVQIGSEPGKATCVLRSLVWLEEAGHGHRCFSKGIHLYSFVLFPEGRAQQAGCLDAISLVADQVLSEMPRVAPYGPRWTCIHKA